MCGLAGVVDLNGDLDIQKKISMTERMSAHLTHRGPDANGIWFEKEGRCVLGHRRLSIIDLDARSNQPMISKNGRYALVFNGEIYNYRLLREELSELGELFHTESDTEVLLKGYQVWGPQLFAKLDGMFALAIYDCRTCALTLARDRVGEKPLFYTSVDGCCLFSSEMKSLLALDIVSNEISAAGLYEYLAMRYVADPNTIFNSIKSVQPGTYLIVSPGGGISEVGYYAYDVDNSNDYDESDYLERVEAALIESVATRLNSDVPLGAFLSSGVDSSLVCGVAAIALGKEIRCFSAGFAGAKDNEVGQARAIADAYGLPFESYLVSEDDILSTAKNFGRYLDEPNGDRGCVPMYFLSRMMRSHVTVAVSGDGGDELFAGYGRYIYMNAVYRKHNRNPVDDVCLYLGEGLPVFSEETLRRVFPKEHSVFRARVAARFSSLFARQEIDDVSRLRTIDMHTYLPGAVLAKVDRMSMRHSLEVRTPFFHPEVMRLSSCLPVALQHHGGRMKIALRRLLGRYLDVELVNQQKQGFGMPGTFMQEHANIFLKLADDATSTLAEWRPLRESASDFDALAAAAKQNTNSLWAWTVLGQWVASLRG